MRSLLLWNAIIFCIDLSMGSSSVKDVADTSMNSFVRVEDNTIGDPYPTTNITVDNGHDDHVIDATNELIQSHWFMDEKKAKTVVRTQ